MFLHSSFQIQTFGFSIFHLSKFIHIFNICYTKEMNPIHSSRLIGFITGFLMQKHRPRLSQAVMKLLKFKF